MSVVKWGEEGTWNERRASTGKGLKRHASIKREDIVGEPSLRGEDTLLFGKDNSVDGSGLSIFSVPRFEYADEGIRWQRALMHDKLYLERYLVVSNSIIHGIAALMIVLVISLRK